MSQINLDSKSEISKNVAIVGIVMLIAGMISHLLFLYFSNGILLLSALLLESFGFAFMIGGGIKFLVYRKNSRKD